LQPGVKVSQRSFSISGFSGRFFHFLSQGWKEAEIDIHRLEIFAVGVGDMGR